ncbi:MAG TPA: hypothetical protein P5186_23705 [Candidatus Paceibacterota bacterium]|nr:hypothetical protein [Verrucomicrobiota bacterium]HRY51065.1 hypothetical protein [Candidatus Paceibacterota bacterium]
MKRPKEDIQNADAGCCSERDAPSAPLLGPDRAGPSKMEGDAPSAPCHPSKDGASFRDDPERQHPPHHPPIARHNQSIIIFLTVCANKRKRIFAHAAAVKTVTDAWRQAETWLVGCYIFMPDHIHLFCAPRDPAVPLKNWVSFWKSVASQHWPRPEEQPIWQRDFWDTQLRRGEHYAAKWHYVRLNPVRKGLLKDADNWPYLGELNPLAWHD